MADTEEDHPGSLAERARSVLSNVEQDNRVRQAAAVTKNVAVQAEEASKTVSRKVTQEDAWNEARRDAELLTEISRAHHALIIDLLDRVAALEARAANSDGG